MKKYFFLFLSAATFFPYRVLAALGFDNEGWLGNLGLPTGKFDSTVLNIISYALTFFGLISVIFILYGGYTYLTAGGEKTDVDKAKSIIRRAIIGMVIIILSYTIMQFVYTVVTEQATG